MKMDDTRVNPAGLMRCCIATLMNLAEDSPAKEYGDGAVVQCRYTPAKAHQMFLVNGIWRWLNPTEAEKTEDWTRSGRRPL